MSTIFDEIRLCTLNRLFDAEDASTVNRWFKALLPKPPVVLVGAGFSRNARGGEALPLWRNVGETLAEIAGVDADAHEVLTLADYAWTDNRNACVRQLRASLPDHRVFPAKAHRALFRSQVAAVVTTNNLDTLLDRSPVWHRITRDLDLSLNHEQRPPLIYLHGHRDSPEDWVFTRSQYENIIDSRPVIYSKVRQLLAEFPVLCVGFGLSDPNFHNIYRRVAVELGGLQDRGLAILPSRVSDAERLHWSSLGLRIVQIRDMRSLDSPRSYDELFADFFGLNPSPGAANSAFEDLAEGGPTVRNDESRDAANSPLMPPRDRSSPDDAESLAPGPLEPEPSEFELAKTLILEAPGFPQRLRYWQEYVDAYEEDELSRWRRTELWQQCLVAEISDDSARAFSTPSSTDGVADLLLFLPRPRFNPWWRDAIVQTLDRHLERRFGRTNLPPEEIEPIIDWLLIRVGGIVDELPHLDTRPETIIGLAAYLIARLGSGAAVRPALRKRLQSKLRRCSDAASRFDLPLDQAPLGFSSDFKALGIEREPGSPPVDSFLGHMERAANALGDADYTVAAELYRLAYRHAQKDAFRRWLALEGIAQTLHRDRSVPQEGSTYKDALVQVRVARQDRKVARWIDRARSRREELLRDTIRGQGQGGAQGPVWRSFRDLETHRAPDHLLRRELEPLLASGEAIDDPRGLRYRISLSLRTADSRAWLTRLANAGTTDASGPSSTPYAELVDVALESYRTRWSRNRQLELTGELVGWAEQHQEPGLRTVLLGHLQMHADHDYRMIELTGAGHLTRCWSVCDRYLSIASSDGVKVLALAYLRSALEGVGLSLRTNIGDWAWERWTLEDQDSTFALWNELADAAGDASAPYLQGSLTHALSVIAPNSTGGTRESVYEHADRRLRATSSTSATRNTPGDEWAQTAAFVLRWTVADEPGRARLVGDRQSALLEGIGRAAALEERARMFALQDLAVAMRNLSLLGEQPGDAATLWFEQWEPVAAMDRDVFGGSAFALGHALGWAVLSVDEDVSGRAAQAMTDAVRRDPFVLGGLARPCTSPSSWRHHWAGFMRTLQHVASGSSCADADERRLGLLRGLTELHRNRVSAVDVPDPAFVSRFRELPFLLAGAADGQVARAAVQALGFMVQVDAFDDFERICDVFALAVADPRPKVRASAAYATTRVSRFGHPDLKPHVAAMSAELEGSANLGIRHSHSLAKFEAQYARPPKDT